MALNSPQTLLCFGPDGGPFTTVGTATPLPVTANAGTGTYIVGGVTGDGSALSGNPVRVGGSDGTNLRTLLTDTSGRTIVIGAAAIGAAAAGNPVQVGFQDVSGNVQVPRVNSFKALLGAPHNSDKATYALSFGPIAPTSATDLFAIESGASKIVRIRRIVITNPGNQTTGGLVQLQLTRTNVAGSGGATIPSQLDNSDTGFSGTCRVNPGTLGTAVSPAVYVLPIFVPAALADHMPIVFDFGVNGTQITKCPTGIAGTANGLSLRHPGSAGAANISGYVEFTEEAS